MLKPTFLNRLKRPKSHRKRLAEARHGPPAELLVETLEARIVPYSTSGNEWPHPELVTISFMPDGTNIAGQASDLVGDFNTKFGSAAAWQNQMLKAAQVWAQQTNLNFTVLTDNGGDSGSGSYQQGDSGFGDIRIGGYDFGNSTLALANMPPPANNYSIAGDITFNTGQTFNIGSTYDVFTVTAHEIGHALGLNHSTSSLAVMYSAYNGTDTALNSDDINGIRAIYGGARAKDSYDNAASNGTFGTASNITSLIDSGTKTALVENLDVTTTSDIDYYKFTAPSGGTGTLVVHVQSSGLSLLTPKAWVYNNSQSQLAVATGTGLQGSTLTLTVNVTAGQNYYVKVDGADATAFGTGKYAVTLNFGTGADPTVPLPNTQTPNGDPLQGGGGVPQTTDVFDPRGEHEGHGHRGQSSNDDGSSSDDDDRGQSRREARRAERLARLFARWQTLIDL